MWGWQRNLAPVTRLVDGGEEFLRGERFGERVTGAKFLGDPEISARAGQTAGHRDDGQVRPFAADLDDGLDTFLAGHHQVGQNEVDLGGAEEFAALVTVVRPRR